MQFPDWDRLGKQFYLLDTFRGVDERYVSNEELVSGVREKSKAAIDSGFYVVGSQSGRAYFSEWKNIRIIKGAIPETLPEVSACQIAFCHIDVNCSPPEVAALSPCFWDRLVPSAMVLLEMITRTTGINLTKGGMDWFEEEKAVMIASRRTGQGLLVKTQSPERTGVPIRYPVRPSRRPRTYVPPRNPASAMCVVRANWHTRYLGRLRTICSAAIVLAALPTYPHRAYDVPFRTRTSDGARQQ